MAALWRSGMLLRAAPYSPSCCHWNVPTRQLSSPVETEVGQLESEIIKGDGMQTVLVVDDERVIREGCRRLLMPEGFEVLTAENGREALDLLLTHSPDVILCDLLMPVMGAFEVIEEVRVKYPDLPLIVITGHGTVATAVEAMRKGAYDFITKPFAADHLILIIKRALEKRALELCARQLQETQVQNLMTCLSRKAE